MFWYNTGQQESRGTVTTVCHQEDDDGDDDDDEDEFVDTPLQQLRMRFPTIRLTDFVSGLKNTQKACLNNIGFGSTQTKNWKIFKIIGVLGCWQLQSRYKFNMLLQQNN